MAAGDVSMLATQLKKLTKDDLINIIITGNIPQSAVLSEPCFKQLEQLLKYRNEVSHEENGFEDPQARIVDPKCNSVDESRKIKNLPLERENELLKRLCHQMEGRVSEQVLLIDLLRKNRENYSISRSPKTKTETPLPSGVTLPNKVDLTKRTGEDTGKQPVNRQTLEHSSDRKPKFIRGSGQIPAVPIGAAESTFAAVARRAYLYVGNINPQTTKGEVLQYIKSRRANDEVVLEELPMRENAYSRAFKLIIDFNLMDVFNKPEFWPQGVIVKRFFRVTRRPGTENGL